MKIAWLGLEPDVGLNNVLLLNKSNFSLEKLKEFKPDIVVEREFNADGLDWHKEIPLIKQELPDVKTAVWLIDTHVRLEFHKQYAILFDYVFLAISKYLDEIDHPNKFWLPLCFTASSVKKYPENRPYHIGFVGRYDVKHLEERTAFMYMIKDIFPKFHLLTDFNTVYDSMGKIEYMVNLSYNGDMNFRTFESLACGCGLITSDVPDLYKIKGLAEKITIFDSFNSCIDAIRSKIDVKPKDHSDWVMKNHTLKNRIKAIVEMIETNIQKEF